LCKRVVRCLAETNLSGDVSFPELIATGSFHDFILIDSDPTCGSYIECVRQESRLPAFIDPKETGPARTAEIFSTCSRQHRAAECGYVERDLTGGLTGIQQVWDVVRPRNATDFRGRLHDAIIGRHMR